MGFNSGFKGLKKTGTIKLLSIGAFMADYRLDLTFTCYCTSDHNISSNPELKHYFSVNQAVTVGSYFSFSTGNTQELFRVVANNYVDVLLSNAPSYKADKRLS